VLLIVFGGFLFVAVIWRVFRGEILQFLGGIFLTLWFLCSVASTFWVAGFRCPRCGERFFQGHFHRNGFARRCLHCGLPKWEEV
jgi:hypothetical protein